MRPFPRDRSSLVWICLALAPLAHADETSWQRVMSGERKVGFVEHSRRVAGNQVIEAEKRAAANVVLRREETAATRSLANTARLLEQNPVLLRLKELESLERLAEKVGSITVVASSDKLLGSLRLPG